MPRGEAPNSAPPEPAQPLSPLRPPSSPARCPTCASLAGSGRSPPPPRINSFPGSLTPPSGPSPYPELPPLAPGQKRNEGGPPPESSSATSPPRLGLLPHPRPEPLDAVRSWGAKGADGNLGRQWRHWGCPSAPPPRLPGTETRTEARGTPPTPTPNLPLSLPRLSDTGRRYPSPRSLGDMGPASLEMKGVEAGLWVRTRHFPSPRLPRVQSSDHRLRAPATPASLFVHKYRRESHPVAQMCGEGLGTHLVLFRDQSLHSQGPLCCAPGAKAVLQPSEHSPHLPPRF